MSQNFKSQVIADRCIYMHPLAQQIMKEMITWIEAKGENAVITETVTTLKEDAKVSRKHSTHREGRAFDVRTRDWPRELVKEFETHFEKLYGSMGAVGSVTLIPNFLLFHDIGHGEHFHVQLAKRYAVEVPKDMDAKKIA